MFLFFLHLVSFNLKEASNLVSFFIYLFIIIIFLRIKLVSLKLNQWKTSIQTSEKEFNVNI